MLDPLCGNPPAIPPLSSTSERPANGVPQALVAAKVSGRQRALETRYEIVMHRSEQRHQRDRGDRLDGVCGENRGRAGGHAAQPRTRADTDILPFDLSAARIGRGTSDMAAAWGGTARHAVVGMQSCRPSRMGSPRSGHQGLLPRRFGRIHFHFARRWLSPFIVSPRRVARDVVPALPRKRVGGNAALGRKAARSGERARCVRNAISATVRARSRVAKTTEVSRSACKSRGRRVVRWSEK